MKQDIHDWKSEHFHSEGWRMKNAALDAITGAVSLATGGVKYHIHNYTVINVPAEDRVLPNGMNASNWAYTPKFMCRCGDVLAEGSRNIEKLFGDYNGWWDDNDIASLYPYQQTLARGLRKGKNIAVITAAQGMGKSKFAEMYLGRFTDED